MDKLEKMIYTQAYTGAESEVDPFSFSVITHSDGQLYIDEGTYSDEFFVGFTSKALLNRLDRYPGSFVFHVDATFKISQGDYTTFVCGISDKARTFPFVALFVASQRQESQYSTMLVSLRYIYQKVIGKLLVLHYVMGDAEDAL
ncbi:hypothetical protein PF008_g6675 [Phytophthora fragariae]|uniref:MULE transposase domain-containing protein n=1 Tax=Phytophthora fragariae TaxID=53985 RepID=A0A6G0S4R8_9STRA|nr:hypothetical protein PF008_g6675 [Phytophthora fragariae]